MSDLHTTSSSSAPPRKRPGAVFGMGGPGAMMKGEKARNFKGTMKKLLAYLNKFKAPIIVVMLFAAGSTVFSILGPKSWETRQPNSSRVLWPRSRQERRCRFHGYRDYFAEHPGSLSPVRPLQLYPGWIMSGVSIKITYQFRKDILAKINRMPLKYFDGTNHGEVLSA